MTIDQYPFVARITLDDQNKYNNLIYYNNIIVSLLIDDNIFLNFNLYNSNENSSFTVANISD